MIVDKKQDEASSSPPPLGTGSNGTVINVEKVTATTPHDEADIAYHRNIQDQHGLVPGNIDHNKTTLLREGSTASTVDNRSIEKSMCTLDKNIGHSTTTLTTDSRTDWTATDNLSKDDHSFEVKLTFREKRAMMKQTNQILDAYEDALDAVDDIVGIPGAFHRSSSNHYDTNSDGQQSDTCSEYGDIESAVVTASLNRLHGEQSNLENLIAAELVEERDEQPVVAAKAVIVRSQRNVIFITVAVFVVVTIAAVGAILTKVTETSRSPTSAPTFAVGSCPDGVCPDGLWCSKFGFCGIGEDELGNPYCTNPPPIQLDGSCPDGVCPGNLCCSKYGFCGTGKEYCS